VTVYDSGLAVDPKWALGLAGKGFGLHRLGRSGEGAALVSRAQQLDPRLARAFYYGGTIAMDRNETTAAKQQFTRALELDPLDEFSAIGLSNLLMKTRDLAGALTVVQHALEIAGNSPRLQAQMGFVLLQTQRPREAVPHLEAAAAAGLESEQATLTALGNLGVAQAMSGDLKGGINTFRKIVSLRPDNADAHGQLGMFLARVGQKDEALRELTRATQLAPGNAGLRQALEAVQQQ
jgi:Flp pilus assembly protein TadD